MTADRMRAWRRRAEGFVAGGLVGALAAGLMSGAPQQPANPATCPQTERRVTYPRRIFEVNRGSPKTVYLFAQVHPHLAESYAENPSILHSQAYIALELDRLIREKRVDRILGEGTNHPTLIPFDPSTDTSASQIEALLRANPREVSYTLLKRRYGPALDLMESGEAGYQEASANQLLEINNRTRLFHFDLARGLTDRDAIAAVFGLAHIPKLLFDIQNGQVTVTEGDAATSTFSRPHIVLYLTGDDFREEERWLEHYLPLWDAERSRHSSDR